MESSFTHSSKALAKRINVKMPEFTIDVTAEEPLQITLTKQFLKLFIDVAIVSLLVGFVQLTLGYPNPRQ